MTFIDIFTSIAVARVTFPTFTLDKGFIKFKLSTGPKLFAIPELFLIKQMYLWLKKVLRGQFEQFNKTHFLFISAHFLVDIFPI